MLCQNWQQQQFLDYLILECPHIGTGNGFMLRMGVTTNSSGMGDHGIKDSIHFECG